MQAKTILRHLLRVSGRAQTCDFTSGSEDKALIILGAWLKNPRALEYLDNWQRSQASGRDEGDVTFAEQTEWGRG